MKKTRLYLFLFVLLFLLPALACGGTDSGGDPTAAPPPTTAPADDTSPTAEVQQPEATAAPVSGAVNNLQDVKNAVIQIVARGTFVDPEVGTLYNAAGSGSGFIIDPSGIAVTNNHVVTGAATLEVYVAGEDRPRNARVLGVSECSDLAVIDIDGDGFSYLEWYQGPIDVGLDVYAAGFPLGDPEYTLTRGIVSKARADGDTSWASVDAVIQHDATINPGNSGGPLVDPNGKVVGVNYAGAAGVDQYFAIARDEALRAIDTMRNGSDVTSLGINGQAVTDGESLYGIWVTSVKSGSPADRARIQPGDIILSLEGLILATDGTMADYCDILRTRGQDQTMSVEVLRFATSEVLEGQFNGRELETTVNFGQMLDDQVADPGSDAPAGGYTYTTITDDSGILRVEVPEQWTDTNGAAWTRDGEEIGVAVSAAPNLDDFLSTWDVPGVFFGASAQIEAPDSLLDGFDFSGSCDYGGRNPYEDPLYAGVYDLWTNCGGQDTLYIVLAATPEDQSFVILVAVQVVSDADLDALDHILNSFIVDI
ncbi:MAG: trypsin-like peptidase domain-containing protein [Anaerolineales bacterium]|nr:trypsin-like peptidase domain-containing protein [Anaerolineales bacterium]